MDPFKECFADTAASASRLLCFRHALLAGILCLFLVFLLLGSFGLQCGMLFLQRLDLLALLCLSFFHSLHSLLLATGVGEGALSDQESPATVGFDLSASSGVGLASGHGLSASCLDAGSASH